MAEIPEYVIRPNIMRLLMPQLIATLVLAILFYIGITINVFLLGIEIPGSVKILLISVLALLVVIQGLLTYVQSSKLQYFIYKNRIQIDPKGEYAMFNSISDVNQKKNFFDDIFHTGTLVLGTKMRLNAVPNIEQTFMYVKQMSQYSKTQYNQV